MDFFTKAYIFHVLPFFHSCTGLSCPSLPVFDFFGIDFSISLVFNTGAAWGFFSDFQFILLSIRLVAILGMFLYLFFINKNRAANIPLVLIISGALGNVIDFFLYGFVVDFLKFDFWGYHFPVFNLADTWITIGVVWLFLAALFTRKKNNASCI
ncbi:MAG: signal peptidase II [Chlamydiales bacterium]|nr:signal peptidase II [Chlamydiales bacterium]